MSVKIDQIIDARGLMCPLPVLKAAKALRGMANGDVLRILADDPIAVIDIPHYCAEAGHTLMAQSEDDDHHIYIIQCGT